MYRIYSSSHETTFLVRRKYSTISTGPRPTIVKAVVGTPASTAPFNNASLDLRRHWYSLERRCRRKNYVPIRICYLSRQRKQTCCIVELDVWVLITILKSERAPKSAPILCSEALKTPLPRKPTMRGAYYWQHPLHHKDLGTSISWHTSSAKVSKLGRESKWWP